MTKTTRHTHRDNKRDDDDDDGGDDDDDDHKQVENVHQVVTK